jgi:hypothetical protein
MHLGTAGQRNKAAVAVRQVRRRTNKALSVRQPPIFICEVTVYNRILRTSAGLVRRWRLNESVTECSVCIILSLSDVLWPLAEGDLPQRQQKFRCEECYLRTNAAYCLYYWLTIHSRKRVRVCSRHDVTRWQSESDHSQTDQYSLHQQGSSGTAVTSDSIGNGNGNGNDNQREMTILLRFRLLLPLQETCELLDYVRKGAVLIASWQMTNLDKLYRAHQHFAQTNIDKNWPFFLLGWFLKLVYVL